MLRAESTKNCLSEETFFAEAPAFGWGFCGVC